MDINFDKRTLFSGFHWRLSLFMAGFRLVSGWLIMLLDDDADDDDDDDDSG